jgi:hypothetical protein
MLIGPDSMGTFKSLDHPILYFSQLLKQPKEIFVRSLFPSNGHSIHQIKNLVRCQSDLIRSRYK